MGIFISYSSKDHEFAEKLAFELVKNGVKVWIDRWSLQAGDSLIDKIQNAISDSSFLLVILSKASTSSEWCRKELNSGLIRELEEKKVVVIPVVIDDCEVPLFLREKLYANFKMDFNDGLAQLLKPLASLISDHIGRSLEDGYMLDYGMDWGIRRGLYKLVIDKVTRYQERPESSVLIQTYIKGNDAATIHFNKQLNLGLDALMKDTIVATLSNHQLFEKKQILLREDKIWIEKFLIQDATSSIAYNVKIRGRILGSDNGMDMLVNYGSLLKLIDSARKKT